jgi:hypothetical protein
MVAESTFELEFACIAAVMTIEMNITGMLSADKLPIFFLKPNFTSRHVCVWR